MDVAFPIEFGRAQAMAAQHPFAPTKKPKKVGYRIFHFLEPGRRIEEAIKPGGFTYTLEKTASLMDEVREKLWAHVSTAGLLWVRVGEAEVFSLADSSEGTFNHCAARFLNRQVHGEVMVAVPETGTAK